MDLAQEDYLRISGFERNFSSFVIDPLYGQIGLTTQERAITDTVIFRRLKRIKQLGLVSEFYSGASHSRFDHSLGTLYITWIMFKRFVDNIQNHNPWVDKRTILSLFPDETIKSLRISALIHDLGHGPFSHYFEGISDHLNAKVDHDLITPFFIEAQELQEERSKSYYGAIHNDEDLTKKFLGLQDEFFACLPESSIRKKILGIIKPDWCSLDDTNFSMVKDFLHNIVYGDVGSDRIDYLLRDTHFTGLSHRFNLLDLLNNITAIFDYENNKLRFAINCEGEDVLDFFLTTRYYHYRLIANDLRNIDLFCQLKERVQEGLKLEQNKLTKFLDLNFGDEIDFEKAIPPLSNWSFERVGSWNLGQIRVDNYRFIVYRLLTGKQRKKYLASILTKLCEDRNKSIKPELSPMDLRIEYVLEKPRIPIISVFRQKYIESKFNPLEENQLNTLVHDDSEMIFGLARTYLAHSSIILYCKKGYSQQVKEFTSKTLSFFIDEELFASILKFDDKAELNRLDIMLFCLYYILTKNPDSASKVKEHNGEAIDLDKTPVITSLNKLYGHLKNIQLLLEIDKDAKEQYEFGKGEAYDPEKRKQYDCPPAVINDLMLFEYSGLIKIAKRNKLINKWDKAANPKYASSYEISYPKDAKQKFEDILGCYAVYYKKLQELINKK